MHNPSDKRKICWPVFDATCLEGGCISCPYGRFIQIDTIRRKVSASRDIGMERAYRSGLYIPKVEWKDA
jgi:hypothetical protein